ncbi:hypothetical protein FRC17_001917 [Serendipita sp. 399]|nr:hypothetical protein FRC17_001917 [Serendipita sp. 399]
MSERVYPLDVSMPKVSTIHVEGKAYEKYLEAMIQMIFNAKDTIVNLLFGAHGGNKFPWENLDEFPRLETFGFDSSRFSKPLSTMFSVYPLPSSTSLSFIMLEINSHIQSGHWRHCNEDRHNFRDMMSRPGRWVGKVVVPFIWREIEPLWVNAYRAREGDKKEHDAFPCCWPCINYMDTHDIRIEDQNGISLREGDGAQFASRMRTFKHELGAEFNDEEGDGL